MKRTPIKRGSSQLKRTPIKARSSKRAAADRKWPGVRAGVIDRDGGLCVALVARGCTGRAEHVHHISRRSQGGKDDPGNLVSLCSACHGYIHDHPAWGYEHGFLVRSE